LLLLAALAAGSTALAHESAPPQTPAFDAAAMEEVMQKIQATEDPNERAALLEQHLTEMHELIAEIHAALGKVAQHVEAQRGETRRLHDHRRFKN
jgi:hypothetical protein